MQLSVRDVSEEVFRAFKARAVKQNIHVGQALTLAMQRWLSEQEDKQNFLDFIPKKGWGKATRDVSKNIDKVLYS
ncbi:hypothetical protein HY489_05075 [Candidatus Woesearchaeota archaeon]|nr:hypothetical protein [Candidatus Woesearchaeota archaeon]